MPQDGRPLESLSDTELAALEDELLLYAELNTGRRTQTSLPRVMLYGVTLVIGVAYLAALGAVLPTQKLGPLNLLLFVVAGLGAVVSTEVLWRAAGRRVRTAVRWLLWHWPVALYVAVTIWAGLRQQ